MNRAASPAAGSGWTPTLVVSTIVMVAIIEASALGYTIVTTGLRAITSEFGTTQGAWLLTAYILAGAVMSPLLGKLADVHGKRKIMLGALGVGAVGALVSTVAPTFEVLILGRALQGTVIASMFLAYSLMRDVFPARVLPMAASVSYTGIGVFTVGMPFLVGIMLDTWGWRSLFAFDFAWILLLGPLLFVTTAETPVRVRSRVDYAGAALLGGGIAAVLGAISLARTLPGAATAALFAVGVILLSVYVRQALRSVEPLVDLRVFGRRPVLLAAVTAAAAFSATAVFASLAPLIAMTPRSAGGDYGLGLSALGYASVTAPQGLMLVLGGLVVGLAVGRVGAHRVMVVGLLLMATGALLGSLRHDTLGQLITAAVIVGLGAGLANGCVPNLVVAATPVDHQGSIASMVHVFQSGFASAAPVILFAILASAARRSPTGGFVYSGTVVTYGLWFMAGAALLGALLAVTVLRSRATAPALAPEPETAS
ncbi:MFS transporter [Streptomyces sp. NPDC058534]|uniref:MFS transporter n=1 Tax=Streptomyces sp. NPDC058534 TaxID=3346541 RepID=UPI003655681E